MMSVLQTCLDDVQLNATPIMITCSRLFIIRLARMYLGFSFTGSNPQMNVLLLIKPMYNYRKIRGNSMQPTNANPRNCFLATFLMTFDYRPTAGANLSV